MLKIKGLSVCVAVCFLCLDEEKELFFRDESEWKKYVNGCLLSPISF